MISKPDVTVLMVVYNEEKFVSETIKSILGQTYKNFIFLIIDDGSTDGTWNKIKSFRDQRIKPVRFLNHIYLTKRLNYGLGLVTTRFVARMDSHNIADKKRLEKQRQFLIDNKKVVLVGSNFIRTDENGKEIFRSNFPLDTKGIKSKIMQKNLIKHASWFGRLEILSRENFYNESFRFAQDYEFLLRLVRKYPVANLPDYLVTERQIKQAMSQKHRLGQAFLVLKAQFLAVCRYGYPWGETVYLFRTIGFIIKTFFWAMKYH